MLSDRISNERLGELLGPELSVIKYAEVYLLAEEVRAARARETTMTDLLSDDDVREQFVAGAMLTGMAYSRDEARRFFDEWLDAALGGESDE